VEERLERHRIALEMDVLRSPDEELPNEWDLDDFLHAVRDGTAKLRRVIRGRVSDEEHDPLSLALEAFADDLDWAYELHWLASASPDAAIQPVEGSARPSVETLVELKALADGARRLAARLRGEGL
jgi:hypothetical protein